MSTEIPTYNIAVIGDTNTGKTSIISQYTRKSFPEQYLPTLLPIEQTKNLDNTCNLAIWDTAGSEDWISLNAPTFHQANAIILLCSIDSQKSLDNIKGYWMPILDNYVDVKKVPLILAVNKSDIPEIEKVITDEQINEMKNEIKAFETIIVSAKENSNVTELFELVANRLIHGNDPNMNLEGQGEKEGNCC